MVFELSNPVLSAIVAMAKNRVIGKNNQLPWHLPLDLQHFKAITTGHPLLMGRKTHESIGRPLPNRANLILTRDLSYRAENCVVVHNIDQALSYCREHDNRELFIIGGEEVYRHCLPRIQKLYLTLVDAIISGDAFFPEIDFNEWEESSHERHEKDEFNAYAFSFILYRRK